MTGMLRIPMRLAGRPTVGGLVQPWVNVALADGGCDFRAAHHSRWAKAWRDGLCQTCGQRFTTSRLVLLAGPNQLARLLFDEPPAHPECAAYASDACPMVSGRMPRYADREHLSEGRRGGVCPTPGCGCDGWVRHPGTGGQPGGDPAHAWYAVWVRGYRLAVNPGGEVAGGAVDPSDVVRVRVVSLPGEGRVSRTLTDDEWRAMVTDPATLAAS